MFPSRAKGLSAKSPDYPAGDCISSVAIVSGIKKPGQAGFFHLNTTIFLLYVIGVVIHIFCSAIFLAG